MPKQPVSFSSFPAIPVLFMIFLSANATLAANFFVATTGNDANNCLAPVTPCKTVQAAIKKSAEGDFITIAAGSYPEAVMIEDRSRLTLVGSGPGTIIVPPTGPLDPNTPLISVDNSRRITVRDLRISGSPLTEGFRIFYSTSVTIESCTVEGNDGAGGGFFINGSHGISIGATIVQDNGLGIRVDGNSQVALSSPPFAAADSIVQRNNVGVQVRSGVFSFQGSGIIQQNGTGILVEGGMLKACCENQPVPRKINNNGTGVFVRTGSTVELRGPLEFVGNDLFALRQFGSGIMVTGRVVFQGNGVVGSSAINMSGGHLFLAGVLSSPIVVKDSPGAGIVMSDGASLRMTNVTVNNNGSHGLRLLALSSALLGQNVLMNNNGGKDLSCTPNSFARGINSGIDTQFCPNFDNSPDPHGPWVSPSVRTWISKSVGERIEEQLNVYTLVDYWLSCGDRRLARILGGDLISCRKERAPKTVC